DLLDLQHYRDQLVASLPYGVRKLVELARALCTEPRLLLLDEPASGLNVEETEDMAFWIEDIQKELGITIIMVEHDMSLVSQVSSRVLALADGRVLALGNAREVQANPAIATVLRCAIRRRWARIRRIIPIRFSPRSLNPRCQNSNRR